MEICFLGPLGKVTGSCTWMRDYDRDWNFLIDCGMQQGEFTAAEWNKCDWPFEASDIQFVILTHAHVDHCGLLPVLYKQGFKGRVYCTKETSELATILLKDSAKFPDTIYTESDVDKIKWHEPKKPPVLGNWHPVSQDLFLRFFRSSHIVGSVSVAIHWGPRECQKSIVFSGDIGPNYEDAEYLPLMRHNMHFAEHDFAVVESTYGSTVRSEDVMNVEQRRTRLRLLIDRTIKQNGVLLIPAFALGRTQDILYDLHWIVAENPTKYESVLFMLDYPLAKKLNGVMVDGFTRTENNGKCGKVRPLWLGKQLFRELELNDKNKNHVHRVHDIVRMTLGHTPENKTSTKQLGNKIAQAWKPIMRPVKNRAAILKGEIQTPSVIVTGSGMGDAGRSASWLPKLLGSESNTVAFTGYCSPSSIGGQIMNLKDTPLNERSRCTDDLAWSTDNKFPKSNIRAKIEILNGYSAHADQHGLLDWLLNTSRGKTQPAGKIVFIQHGDKNQREALHNAAKDRASDLNVNIAFALPNNPVEWLDLEKGAIVIDKEIKVKALEAKLQCIERELKALGG